MGLGEFVDDKSPESGRAYPDHERQEELEEWLEELSDEFPEPIEVDFIEVSPNMTRHCAKAYWDKSDKDRDRYIRLSEQFVEEHTDGQIKSVILHELVHAWLYQNGDADVTERDPIFTYILGAVGAHVSGFGFSDEMMKKYCAPFSDYIEAE